ARPRRPSPPGAGADGGPPAPPRWGGGGGGPGARAGGRARLGREPPAALDRRDGEEGPPDLGLDQAATVGEGVLRVRHVVGRGPHPQPPLPTDLDLLCQRHPPVDLLSLRTRVTADVT